MIRFREHRGSLEESLRTVINFSQRSQLFAHIAQLLKPFREITEEDIRIEPYGYDERIDWQTWIVTVPDYGVIGFAAFVPENSNADVDLNSKNCAALIQTTVGGLR